MALHSTNRSGVAVLPVTQDLAEGYASHGESLASPEFFAPAVTFEALQEMVYPAIRKNSPSGSPIRIWVSGCSTGEHVYSIAMSLVECLGGRASAKSIRIFGTESNEQAIEIARRGRFGRSISETVSSKRLNRFFTPVKRTYQISPAIRDLCIFSKHDVLQDPPFGHLDLLIVKTVPSLSQAGSRRSLLRACHFALKPHGFLALPDGAPVDDIEELFSPRDSKARLYERRDVSRRTQLEFWLGPRRELFGAIPSSGDETARPRNGRRGMQRSDSRQRHPDNHHLQQAIETNRELRSRNREILSYNIELQSTADDLQTKNYELHRAAGESEERFRVFVENAPAAIVMCDGEGKIVSANRRTERMFGYSRRGLIGGSIIALIPEIFGEPSFSYRGTAIYRWPHLLREALETSARRKDGSRIPVEITVSPVETSRGTLLAATILDVTERRRLAEQNRWTAVLEERSRLARDIHDTLAQGFAGIILNLESVEEACARLPAAVRHHIRRARDVARWNLEEARRSILALSSSSRRPGGLAGSIHEMAAHATLASNTPVRFSLQGASRVLDGAIEENLFFIAQQATDNALQHGRPKTIHIGLSFDEASVCLRVQDDGKGFEAGTAQHGFGMRSMQERARYIGSHLLLKSQPGKGTVVKTVVPVTRTSPVVQ